jgi:hypothetical protein
VGVGGGASSGGGGGTSSSSVAGAAAPPPSPASWMARLTPCACLRKKKLLDSLLGAGDGGAGVFLVPRLTKFLAGHDLY